MVKINATLLNSHTRIKASTLTNKCSYFYPHCKTLFGGVLQYAVEAFTSATKFEHTIIRSGALIQLVKALLKAGKADKARTFIESQRPKLEGIKDSIYKSDSYKLVAEAFALLGDWDWAIVMAELCDQKIDLLAAGTAIVREHSIAQNSSLAEVFRKAAE